MENNLQHHTIIEKPSRRIFLGIALLVITLFLWLAFLNNTPGGATTTFNLSMVENRLSGIQPTKVEFNSVSMILFCTAACAAFTFLQFGFSFTKIRMFLGKWFGRWTTLAIIFAVAFLVIAFLTWAAAGRELNVAGLLKTTLNKSVPITLGALAGILCERAGIFNIAIEGMMLMGAMVGAIIGSVAKSSLIGILAAVIAGGLLALLHGLLSIKYKINQIISGTVINILATGLTSYTSVRFLDNVTYQDIINNPKIFVPFEIPILSKIPFIGPILFNNNLYIYMMLFFLALLSIFLYRTRAGLRMRSVGEHPAAADTLGIKVLRTRYIYVLLSGMMAGFAGSYFTLGSIGRFEKLMTGGRGFIGLAAMIFGNYNPIGGFGAGLLFGFADSLKDRMAILDVKIAPSFLLMAPYIATMIVLAGVVGRSQPPAAGGIPYDKE